MWQVLYRNSLIKKNRGRGTPDAVGDRAGSLRRSGAPAAGAPAEKQPPHRIMAAASSLPSICGPKNREAAHPGVCKTVLR